MRAFMKSWCVILAMLCPVAVYAQNEMTLSDLQAKSAQRLSRDDLRTLVSDAKVKSIASTGSERVWRNDPDGTFVASTTNAGAIGAARGGQGRGKWHVSDEGRFCVEIEWRNSTEKWCRVIYRLENAYYGVSSEKSPKSRAYLVEFSK